MTKNSNYGIKKMTIFGMTLNTTTYILKKSKLQKIDKRYYHGGKEVGHVAKIINTLANNVTKTPKVISNNLGPVKENLPILIPPKIKEPNSIIEKYLPLYSAHKLHIPFVINKFPSHGLSGFMTIPENKRNLLPYENFYTQELANLKVRYFCIMYGGSPIKTSDDILNRTLQLFSTDSLVSKNPYNIAPYTNAQHLLAQDTYKISVDTKEIVIPSNMNLSQKTISLTKYNEITLIQKTHKFLFEENRDEILIIDENNIEHHKILYDNIVLIKTIAKQPCPELIGVGLNKKVIYTIDAKLIGNPEINLPMLSSYSSLNPEYHASDAANKMKGTLQNQLNKTLNKHDLFMEDRNFEFKKLNQLLHEKKFGKISSQLFIEDFNNYCIYSFNKQRTFGTFIYDNMSIAPSIISEGYTPNNYYIKLQQTNPLFIEIMEKEAIKHFNFEKHFPELKDMKKYDCYSTTLEDMIFLQRYNMLDNFYKVRQILTIDDYV